MKAVVCMLVLWLMMMAGDRPIGNVAPAAQPANSKDTTAVDTTGTPLEYYHGWASLEIKF